MAGSPIGGTGVGGTGPVGGAAGVAGDGPGRGQIKQACEGFCGPYSATCPDQAGDASECTWSCMQDFGDAPRHCRELTLEALDCLSQNFYPELGCDQALLTAVDACFDVVQRVEACSEDAEPPPMPGPTCPASYQSSQFDCTHTLMCPDAYYYVSCYEVEEGESSCVCEDDFSGGTTFIAQVPLEYACDYAMAFCGYPY